MFILLALILQPINPSSFMKKTYILYFLSSALFATTGILSIFSNSYLKATFTLIVALGMLVAGILQMRKQQ
jgi:hypothetical protein